MSNKKPALKHVIAIGASAGGLEPLQELVGNLPDSMPNAAVIIAQHTSPNYKSLLVSLLGKVNKINIVEAAHDMELEPNRVYTCPPDSNIIIEDNRFKFTKPDTLGPKPNVNQLFSSLAKNYGEKCIGIILSGTGNDGTEGIREIISHKGFTIAQNPDHARYTGMPDSAISTGYINMVLDPEDIGREIPKLFKDSYREMLLLEKEEALTQQEDLDTVTKIIEKIQNRLGTDFAGYKTSTIYRRLEKRITDKKIPNIEAYLKFLEENEEEIDELFLYLLIGVTSFFRNPEAFEQLEQTIRRLLIDRAKQESFRVWVPGCATGEEAYTIGMIICNLISNEGVPAPSMVQIFASDLDQNPLKAARVGIYNKEALVNMPEFYKKNYLTELEDGTFEVTKEIKKLILFSKHDLTTNPPFLRLDLISCRNLLIYFKSELQNQVIPLFHYALNPEGVLFLGKSETIGHFKNLFTPIDAKHKLYRRRSTEARISHIPILRPLVGKRKITSEHKKEKEVLTLSDMVKETMYNTFEHPYVVIDDNMQVIEINKDVSPFIRLKQGMVNLSILKLIEKEYQIELRTIASKAIQTLKPVKSKIKRVEVKGEPCWIRMVAQPVLFTKPKTPLFLIIFETLDIEVDPSWVNSGENDSTAAPIIAELEHELGSTREHMNSLVEELETSNEELQSLNEELQSSNEELQASNEELETSNEELQATNEELNIAYSELRSATNELESQSKEIVQYQQNMESLLHNTQQGFILIDNDYKVILFNKTANKILLDVFNISLKEDELYIDLLPPQYLGSFHENIKNTFTGSQESFEQQVTDRKGKDRYLSFDYTPVSKDASQVVNMVTISVIDITDKKTAELDLIEASKQIESQRKLWQNLFVDAPQLIAILTGPDYIHSFVNKNYEKLFPSRDFMGNPLEKTLPELYHTGFKEKLDQVRISGESFTLQEIAFEFGEKKKYKLQYYTFTFFPITYNSDQLYDIIIYAHDITEQVRARKAIEESDSFVRLLSDSLPQHAWVLNADGNPEYVNEQAVRYLGEDYKQVNKPWKKSFHPEEKKEVSSLIKKAIKKGEFFKVEHRLKSEEGTYRWFLSMGAPLAKSDGLVSKWIISSTDIHDQKRLANKKDEFIGIASHELKTPLTSVKAYTDLLSEHLATSQDESVKLYLKKASSNIKKLEGFINDLLDVSRIQSGKLTLIFDKFELDKLVHETVEGMKPASGQHNIRVKGKSDAIVNGDAGRIEQVIVNFLTNAMKYSPKATEVDVELSADEEEATVMVRDYGIGIPEAERKKIFNRFYRVDEHSPHVSGLGIGLNISKEIIERHGGKIGVENNGQQGSTFYFKLPVVK